ncbi:hypothetical protein [uncultured Microbacterium sp.]|uniref:hypothetical protein n=1 Tax=uncultured Microbacterium sp. TaxID=191216 RepID=UPI0026280CBD|nr:hypothetical protein [uncultured Microbacterium sp.]
MSKNTSPKRVSRYRGRRHRAYKFEVRSAFVSLQQLHDALSASGMVEEHLFVDHCRDDAERHVQGYLRTPRNSKLTEREAVARIAAAGIPPELIRVQPLVGRNAVEAFAHYLTHADEMLKARYEREEFFASDLSIWARVDAWLERKARADEKSDTAALVDRLRQQLMNSEITLAHVKRNYPKLWAAYPGKFKGVENLRANALMESEREEMVLAHRQKVLAAARAAQPVAQPIDHEAYVRESELRERERREAEDRRAEESQKRYEAERREVERLDREAADRFAEQDARADRARELRGLMDAREVELREQAKLDGLDAEALEDLLFDDETLNQYETELKALVST